MPDRVKIGLDNQAFQGRLRRSPRYVGSVSSPPTARVNSSARLFGDVIQNNNQDPVQPTAHDKVLEHVNAIRSSVGPGNTWSSTASPAALAVSFAGVTPQSLEPQSLAGLVRPKPGRPTRRAPPEPGFLRNQLERLPAIGSALWAMRRQRNFMLRLALLGIACLVFIIGVAVSLQTSRANSAAAAQIQTISQQLGQ